MILIIMMIYMLIYLFVCLFYYLFACVLLNIHTSTISVFCYNANYGVMSDYTNGTASLYVIFIKNITLCNSSSVFSKCAWKKPLMDIVPCSVQPQKSVNITLIHLLYLFADEIVSQGRPVAQSSLLVDKRLGVSGTPEKAIDGKRATIWSQNSCARTLNETKPWWRVDLKKT